MDIDASEEASILDDRPNVSANQPTPEVIQILDDKAEESETQPPPPEVIKILVGKLQVSGTQVSPEAINTSEGKEAVKQKTACGGRRIRPFQGHNKKIEGLGWRERSY